jgi:hypothetical protein
MDGLSNGHHLTIWHSRRGNFLCDPANAMTLSPLCGHRQKAEAPDWLQIGGTCVK